MFLPGCVYKQNMHFYCVLKYLQACFITYLSTYQFICFVCIHKHMELVYVVNQILVYVHVQVHVWSTLRVLLCHILSYFKLRSLTELRRVSSQEISVIHMCAPPRMLMICIDCKTSGLFYFLRIFSACQWWDMPLIQALCSPRKPGL